MAQESKYLETVKRSPTKPPPGEAFDIVDFDNMDTERNRHAQFETADPMYYGLLKEFARKNRRFQTDAEHLLWEHLSKSKLGLPFRRQHIIGCYIADFVCIKRKLIVEVDGGYHAQYEQQIKDYWRTEDLQKRGFRVIRFKNEDIHSKLSEVLDEIFNNL